ncbi:MAG TPA: proton-conducting transporter membrane subunit [Flavisolibacter sp.]|jgi:formate hydrogenlyase subunit 3/multisubunit Na+/H+ antiporter MnhD subunit|nr:proton-conducting transporter membrane subunit [Flavisolibacter sp.]
MTGTVLFSLALLLPMAGIVFVLLSPSTLRARINFLFVLLVAIVTSIPAVNGITGSNIDIPAFNNPVFGKIALHIDRLSSWFILIINLTCINGAFYGIGYMRSHQDQKANLSIHWILFLLFQSSMLWVCMMQNTLAFLIVWELMSISSFLLVIFDHQNKNTIKAGINYLVQMHIGILCLTAAFIWIYFSERSFEFSAIENFFSTHSNIWLFFLFFIGFGIKAGFIPLHSWLPQAHPAAPSHISGVMSGVIVKLGIYGILRIAFMLKQDHILIGEIVIVISIFTGLYGILNAAMHRDFKKMLAYCTIENIGIIGIGIGLGLIGIGTSNSLLIVLGFTSALLHTLNHSLFKSLLFFSAGSVYQQTHTRDMERLGGLIRSMPQTAILFLFGGMAIGGLPPFNGFVSEFLLYSGLVAGIKSIGVGYITLMVSSLAALAVIGGISMLTFTKSFGVIFLGAPRTELHHHPKEVSIGMRLPQYFILAIMISIAMFPKFYFSITQKIVADFLPSKITGNEVLPVATLNSISLIGKFAMLLIAVILVIYFARRWFTKRLPVDENLTWGCGYIAPSPAMQYTGKSYSKSLSKLLNFIVLEKKKYKEIQPAEIFPAERKHSSHYNDFFVVKIFDAITSRLLYSLNYFQFIQNGKIQAYILYGVFFIVLIFLGTIFKII